MKNSAYMVLLVMAFFGTVLASPMEMGTLSSRALVNQASCGVNKYGAAQDKIVGGHEAKPHAYPWLASLWLEYADYGIDSHQCGAAIIDKRFLLTAAHCFNSPFEKAESWKVVVGEHDFEEEEGTEIWGKVEKIIVHENYDPYYNRHDIALVKLEEPLADFPFSDFAVNSICLPGKNDKFSGMKCKVAGWGRLRDYGELPSRLQEVELPVFDWKKCNDYRFYKGRVWNTNVCAGFDEGGKDSCQGDSGGPLMCIKEDGKAYLTGVVSWGMGCAARNSPGVYTETSHYLQWIEDNMKSNS